ncbi:MAG: aspartate--ammonia ligase, partial [Traorella sp.]
VKDQFEKRLADCLNLVRVSAPLYVTKASGLNDNLNGVERPVSFEIKDLNEEVEVVHSLAKWKRAALNRYDLKNFSGLYTDMNAIRRDEELDNLHSVYVDQWDWEKIISRKERNLETLKDTVKRIVKAIVQTETILHYAYPSLQTIVNENVFFITTQQLEDLYPDLTPKEREDAITRKHSTVFLMKIGDELKSGIKHDGRAPDYDDWELNGDLLVYYPILDRSFEISSMGIRVDEKSLVSQCEKAHTLDRLNYPYHQAVLQNKLPLTIGGGIGQSRLCMLLLNKAHIGEVQVSMWSEEMRQVCKENKMYLL